MRIDIATLFPEMCAAFLNESIIGKAKRAGKIEAHCHNIRSFATNTRASIDEYPYGGGPGMVMQAEPIALCCEEIERQVGKKPHVIFMGAGGKVLTQERCKELAALENITIVCGHYEGIDQRVIDLIADEEISIGDYVLTGGEMAALVLADSIFRLCDGVLSSPEGFENESHWAGLLEHPQFTRPETWRGLSVPPVLLSGNHAEIARWREEEAVRRTKERRPDMYEKYAAEQK